MSRFLHAHNNNGGMEWSGGFGKAILRDRERQWLGPSGSGISKCSQRQFFSCGEAETFIFIERKPNSIVD